VHIYCLGLNHTTASLSLRERLAFSEESISAALARLGCGGWNVIDELIIVSTCNRIEFYAVAHRDVLTDLEAFLSEAAEMPAAELQPILYRLKDTDAVSHLLDVAAGLDSLVIGEPQILGQVTRALELARGQNAAGPLLNRLFQSAIHAGKRARTETAIGRNPASISSLAASLAERAVSNLGEAQIVVLGAGEMAELAVEALRKRGAKRIMVVNRTLSRAHMLADRWGADVTTFENLDTALASADILIASTGAPHTIVSASLVSATMPKRDGRPLVLIDIAVPRDIEPEAANIPHVCLYDIDNLNAHFEQSLLQRSTEIPRVKAILAEELEKFMDFLRSLDMLPLIAEIHQHAEAIRQAELDKTLRRLPDLTEAERGRIDALTQALVNRVLENTTRRLRSEAISPTAVEYAALARSLFGLENDSSKGDSGAGPMSPIAAD
jgi:glutamyl-tRNA reductase